MLLILLCGDQESRKGKESLAKDTDRHTGVSVIYCCEKSHPKLSGFKQPTLVIHDFRFGHGECSAKMAPLCSTWRWLNCV